MPRNGIFIRQNDEHHQWSINVRIRMKPRQTNN